MTSKQQGSLLSMKRSNSLRPPSTSTIPLAASSAARLNRASEIIPSTLSTASRRSNENRPPAVKRKEATPQPSSVSSSRPSSRSSTREDNQVRTETRMRENSNANKETNIHVVVRCRGRNDRELKENSSVAVSATGHREVTIQTGPMAHNNKTYSFDHVFGPEADQSMIYDDVVAPILEEALSGYNCTIFAYGQTGTGKTYTMSGDINDTYGTFAHDAGIIPRVMYKLFTALEAEQSEYSVKCSFIELYNEELRDLINKEDDRKVKIFEDSNKKGIVIQGMEESFIKTASDGLKVLQEGSHKRQVAATKCNDLSSRSHTVFTITVHVKEISSAGEEYLRIGKLNLVDLAGSENISRSGAENKRAREAGMINQSLLTLGRVINALVDKSSHIPYRESKLTRLLQDSLGGRTKTCIIATISPAKMNLEETISTLDYASRAKNIRNKPQLNQVMSKKTLIKEYVLEIERLKADLAACRQKNGVYITQESYQDITAESESRRVQVDEQKRKIEVMETQLRTSREQYEQSLKIILQGKKELEMTTQDLRDTRTTLGLTERDLVLSQQKLSGEMKLRQAYEITEQELRNAAEKLMGSVQQASSDVRELNSTIDKKTELEATNREIFAKSQMAVVDSSRQFETKVSSFAASQTQFFEAATEKLQTMLQAETAKLGSIYKLVDESIVEFGSQEGSLKKLMSSAKAETNQVLDDIKILREEIKSKVGEGLNGLNNATEKIAQELMNQIEIFQGETSTSYNQLGRDFKGVFDDMQRYMHSQNAEIEKLHAALINAAAAASTEIETRSETLQAVADEEQKFAEAERVKLVEDMSSLVNAMVRSASDRLASKIKTTRDEMASSKASLDNAGHEFVTGVSGWLSKQGEYQRLMVQNKERIKQSIIDSYHATEHQGQNLQDSTKAIHSEAVKIVASQKENLAVQMQALDEFASRAKAQNEAHHTAYNQAVDGIEKTIHGVFKSANAGIEESGQELHIYAKDANRILVAASANATEYSSSSVKEYGVLRDKITNVAMSKYTPTGHTPKKGKKYEVPATLPKTRIEELGL
ncbi:P-loop containing nucleoside triphosphate hydrolase protein [Lipomyces arxii]|uniref:P-loop containing nucleoside triphosphate hydrolase protein n=1 Tax=Lipomyces arxii TaxID=56418 RepID=UPI0034D010A7